MKFLNYLSSKKNLKHSIANNDYALIKIINDNHPLFNEKKTQIYNCS